jgi:hypothetical protein
MILWSLQPLKDTFFFLLITALIYALWRWQEAPRNWVPCAAATLLVVYEIAGTRWYFAAIVWGISAIFFLLSSIRSRRWWPALILFLLLGPAFRFGGDTDIPEQLRNPLAARTTTQPEVAVPAVAAVPEVAAVPAPAAAPIKELLTAPRKGFESTPGGTAIHAGTEAPSPIATGAAATFIPRAAAQPLHLVRIGGGRGFWFFADFDTVIFSAVILFAMILCLRALRNGARITPLFVLVVLVFLATAGPMIYTVTNFGTLFRLRSMLYVLAVLAPLTLRLPEPAR